MPPCRRHVTQYCSLTLPCNCLSQHYATMTIRKSAAWHDRLVCDVLAGAQQHRPCLLHPVCMREPAHQPSRRPLLPACRCPDSGPRPLDPPSCRHGSSSRPEAQALTRPSPVHHRLGLRWVVCRVLVRGPGDGSRTQDGPLRLARRSRALTQYPQRLLSAHKTLARFVLGVAAITPRGDDGRLIPAAHASRTPCPPHQAGARRTAPWQSLPRAMQ